MYGIDMLVKLNFKSNLTIAILPAKPTTAL
jgi:hypothetical protein